MTNRILPRSTVEIRTFFADIDDNDLRIEADDGTLLASSIPIVIQIVVVMMLV